MAVSAETIRAKRTARPSSAPRLTDAAFARYLRALDEMVDQDDAELPRRAAQELSKLVTQDGWLPTDCCRPGEEGYRRHLLYADPLGRYTVLSLVWRPGQATPVHGHTAWGAVGVYRGTPTVENYRMANEAPVSTDKLRCHPGDVTHVAPGAEMPHRIFNDSDAIAITIHTYGRDLTLDPTSINIYV